MVSFDSSIDSINQQFKTTEKQKLYLLRRTTYLIGNKFNIGSENRICVQWIIGRRGGGRGHSLPRIYKTELRLRCLMIFLLFLPFSYL